MSGRDALAHVVRRVSTPSTARRRSPGLLAREEVDSKSLPTKRRYLRARVVVVTGRRRLAPRARGWRLRRAIRTRKATRATHPIQNGLAEGALDAKLPAER